MNHKVFYILDPYFYSQSPNVKVVFYWPRVCRYELCYDQLRGEDDSLRLEMENLKGELSSLRADQEAKEATYTSTEASLRSEV